MKIEHDNREEKKEEVIVPPKVNIHKLDVNKVTNLEDVKAVLASLNLVWQVPEGDPLPCKYLTEKVGEAHQAPDQEEPTKEG